MGMSILKLYKSSNASFVVILWPTRDSLLHPGAEAVTPPPAPVAGGHRPS